MHPWHLPHRTPSPFLPLKQTIKKNTRVQISWNPFYRRKLHLSHSSLTICATNGISIWTNDIGFFFSVLCVVLSQSVQRDWSPWWAEVRDYIPLHLLSLTKGRTSRFKITSQRKEISFANNSMWASLVQWCTWVTSGCCWCHQRILFIGSSHMGSKGKQNIQKLWVQILTQTLLLGFFLFFSLFPFFALNPSRLSTVSKLLSHCWVVGVIQA